MTMKYLIIHLVLCMLLGIVGILVVVLPMEKTRKPPEYMYGVILDAGSSHTSMYIYKWPADKLNDTGIVSQHSECHVKGGGISIYAGKPGGAASSLEACLNQAMMDIPKSRHTRSPVYLGATAGMRLLNESSPKETKQILDEVGSKLRTYPFNYRGAVILSGQEEGAYGWVTVNYLTENFVKYGFVGRWLNPGRDTVGALDLGGASTQITFETSEHMEDTTNRFKLELYGQDYHLYTQSFLCYGRDQLLRKLLAILIKNQGLGTMLSHPCYPKDVSLLVSLDTEVFDSPCTSEYRPASLKPQQSVTFQGTGNYQQCYGNVSELFSFATCPYSKCSFNGVFQPNVTGNFMAFSAFYYTHDFLQRATSVTVTSPSDLDAATRSVCNMTSSEILQKVPGTSEKLLKDYCAASSFMQLLLLKGYGFDDTSFPWISFQKKAGDTSIGWALGYMLTVSNILPAESLSVMNALPPWSWAVVVVILVVLLFVTAFLIAITCRNQGVGNMI